MSVELPLTHLFTIAYLFLAVSPWARLRCRCLTVLVPLPRHPDSCRHRQTGCALLVGTPGFARPNVGQIIVCAV